MKQPHPLVFAVFAEDEEQARHAHVLVRSIRRFAGSLAGAPIWLALPAQLRAAQAGLENELSPLGVELLTTDAPAESLEYCYARKVFAAARVEARAAQRAALLVWLDEDTLVVREPAALLLDPQRSFGYRAVMHNRSGSAWDQPPDPFWGRIYQLLGIPEAALFPMCTPADRVEIRPYFNAGLLVLRPQRGLLRRWAECFELLYRDPVLAGLCAEDPTRRTFLHQAALVGPPLLELERWELCELPASYNYPLFFQDLFGAEEAFTRLEQAVTLRYDVYFRDPAPDWRERLEGPAALIDWIAEHLAP